MFVDQIKIEVTGGRGGNGMCSYRREKYVEFGGPWGGNGGKGGDIVFLGDSGMTTLYPFRFMRHIKAKSGGDGMSKGKTGRSSDDTIIKVPLGTIVKYENGDLIGEIKTPGETLIVARGGKGGRGNISLSTHKNPTPDYAEKGDPGDHMIIELELKVLADVGFIGFPSVGKSSLVASLSNAKTKIADYPFTTLSPQLGMVLAGEETYAIADLPGLIEEAHLGAGLGIQFLKHLARCRVFVHVIDGTDETPLEKYEKIRFELSQYDPKLLEREEVIVINKSDMIDEKTKKALKMTFKKDVLFTSAITQDALLTLKFLLLDKLHQIPVTEEVQTKKVYTLEPLEEDVVITKVNDQHFKVTGKALYELYMRTDMSNDEAIKRLTRQMRALGVDELLKKNGATDGATVELFDFVFEYVER
jgi:GTPase